MGRSWAGERKKGKVSGLEAGREERAGASWWPWRSRCHLQGWRRDSGKRGGPFPLCNPKHHQGSLASAPLPQDGFVPENVAWSGPKFLLRVY